MTSAKAERPTIELWDGFAVEVNTKLMDDFDFSCDLSDAIRNDDIATIVSMYTALIGGDEAYTAIRDHIESEHGYFSQGALLEIIEKVNSVLPKGGNRAQRRSWKSLS